MMGSSEHLWPWVYAEPLWEGDEDEETDRETEIKETGDQSKGESKCKGSVHLETGLDY